MGSFFDLTDGRKSDTIGYHMIITELQPHDTTITWSGQLFDTSKEMLVPVFERPAPDHEKPDATSIDTSLSSSPTEWNSHELARLHREGHPDAAYLNAAYYGVFDGQAPDGSGPIEYVAYKPLPPDVYAIKSARDAAYNDLDSGQKAMASGSLISALYLGVPDTAERLTRGIKNPTLRIIARRSIEALGYGSLIGGAAGCLGRSVAPPVSPTLPPPGGEVSMPPTLSAAQETGAMIANTQVGRDFYDALSVHNVDPSLCSPDVLGNLVIEKNLPLGEASDLMTITTDALAATSEPDHLTGIVCDVKEADNGTQTVSFFFNSDTDHTGDGALDIYIPSQAKVLLPGELVAGVPQVVVPAVGGKSPTGALVEAPDWSPAGGEIPAEIRGLMADEEQSIRDSLVAQGIDPNSVLIQPVSRGSGDDFRMGSGVTNVNQTIAFYPQFDDDGALAWRPDLRSIDRPWHWQSVSLPDGVNGKIEVVFDSQSEAPQFVALTADESKMIGWFNNLTGQWLTGDGQELVASPPPPTSTPEPSPTPVIVENEEYIKMEVKLMAGQTVGIPFGVLDDEQVRRVMVEGARFNSTFRENPNAIFVSGIARSNIHEEGGKIVFDFEIPTENGGLLKMRVLIATTTDERVFSKPCSYMTYDNFNISHDFVRLVTKNDFMSIPLDNKQIMVGFDGDLPEGELPEPPSICRDNILVQRMLIQDFSINLIKSLEDVLPGETAYINLGGATNLVDGNGLVASPVVLVVPDK